MKKGKLKDKLNRWKAEQQLAAEATLERPERYPVPAVEWARGVLGLPVATKVASAGAGGNAEAGHNLHKPATLAEG